MKHLSYSLIVSFLFLAGGLSAQQYRLRADFGTSGAFNSAQISAPVASFSLEALINLSPRMFLVPEVGLQHTRISNGRLRAARPPVNGLILVNFDLRESYEMKQNSAFVGLGLERHFDRVRLQIFGKAMRRLNGQATFTEETDFQGDTRPNNVFSVTVKPDEIFVKDMQLGTLRYDEDFTFHAGFSIRYDLTKGFEIGVSYLNSLGYSQLERRIISFCENCDITPDAAPVRVVDAETNTISLSSRFTF